MTYEDPWRQMDPGNTSMGDRQQGQRGVEYAPEAIVRSVPASNPLGDSSTPRLFIEAYAARE